MRKDERVPPRGHKSNEQLDRTGEDSWRELGEDIRRGQKSRTEEEDNRRGQRKRAEGVGRGRGQEERA